MSRLSFFIVVSILYLIPSGFKIEKSVEWTSLFNGKDLEGWDTYLGPAFDSTGKKINEQPIGLNIDPSHIFSVVTLDGENVIRISGERFGAITSKKEYENYHLRLMFRWGQ